MVNFFLKVVLAALCCAFVFPAYSEDIALVVGSDITSFATVEKSVKDYLAQKGQASVDILEVAKTPDFVAKVQEKKYKVICVLGSNPFKKIKDKVKDTPLVFSMVLNPVESGVVSSMGASGQNFTGVSLDVPAKIQLELFKKITPGIKNIGVFYSVKSEMMVNDSIPLQGEFDVKLVLQKIAVSTDVPGALRSIGPIDALWVVPDTVVCTKDTLPLILNFASEKKVPVLVFADYLVKAGALAAYTYDYVDIGIQTGELVLKVINGENPGTIPIAMPRKVGYVINTKTAKYLEAGVSSAVLNAAEHLFE